MKLLLVLGAFLSLFLTKPLPTTSPTIIPSPPLPTITPLPSKHLIKTAFIPQAPEHIWTEPWQDFCEEASLLTVYYYYQHLSPTSTEIKQALLDIGNFETEQGFTHDINTTQMSYMATTYFYLTPTIITNPTLLQLKTYLAQSVPIIVPASGKILYTENHNFSHGGPWYHNIVLLGFDDSTQKFIVHDVGTRLGAYFKYSYDLLIQSIHDLPSSGNPVEILSGPQKVLVLEKLL